MTELGPEGQNYTTTTVIDSKNGSVPKSPGKVLKRSVTEDIVTTFSSPAAWLLVAALIVTWSAVAVVMFDLVDYKNFSASSVSKIGSDPLRIINEAVEETTDWVYGFFSLLSDIISSDGEEDDEDDINDEGEIEPPSKDKEIHKDKSEKQEKREKKPPHRVTPKDKPEKIVHRAPPKVTPKEKLEKEKPEKKAAHKDKHEKEEKRDVKTLAKEDKKSKSLKAEERSKREVKVGKVEKVKQTEAKAKETEKTPAKSKGKDDKLATALDKAEKKDQFAFCRYMIDMFAQGDLKPGTPPPVLYFSVLIGLCFEPSFCFIH
ncbi:triadin isoform X1 [Ornithorhynchus anatinus]|uniref:triadin isoform X1 n=1 Tax=Ornithorhynchus anatinus TaxID=9258 RepID=UPI0010A7BBFC|nr:triadin isoform X1 [Ornithorhynchus anatinus]